MFVSGLPVATGAVLWWVDVLGGDDLVPDFRTVAVRLPAELRHVFNRAQVRSGIAMTIETPPHAERLDLLHNIHLVHTSVATDAAHARGNVRLVIEINVIRKLMNLDPRNRLPRCVTLAHFQQSLTLRLDPRMAVHASGRGGNRGVRGFVYRVMTVVAIHPEIAGMKLMTVRNRLNGRVARVHHTRMREVCVGSGTGDGEQAYQNARDSNILISGSREDECHSERNCGTGSRPAEHSTSVLNATDLQNQTATGPSREFLP